LRFQGFLPTFGHGFVNLFLIEGIRFPLFDGKGALRALADAGAQAVAENIAHQFGLAVDDFNGFFGAARHAQTAAGALFFIDFDDLAFHTLDSRWLNITSFFKEPNHPNPRWQG
jgi:hypothetical protein